MKSKLLLWAIGSTHFKKWSAFFGGLATGIWFMARFHREIKATLEVWGITNTDFMAALLAVMGAAGIGMSVAASEIKRRTEKP